MNIIQDKDLNWFNNRRKNIWNLSLTSLVPLSLYINMGACSFNFDLQDIIIEELKINSGVGDMEMYLGSHAKYIEINSAAINFELNIPDNKAVSIRTNGVISNKNFGKRGLIKAANNTYQTPDFEESDHKMLIVINAAFSNIQLDVHKVD